MSDPVMTDDAAPGLSGNRFRRSARLLGVLSGGFLLLMFLGYVVQGRGPSPGSLEPFAALSLVLMGTYAVAMFMALRWEHAGALIGAVVLAGFNVIMFLGLLPGNVTGGFSPRGVLNPILLALWLPLILHFISWRIDKRHSR